MAEYGHKGSDPLSTPAELPVDAAKELGIWDFFVRQCEHGYQFCDSEYNNEIRSRDGIERLLQSPEFRNRPGFAAFAQEVETLDQVFRRCLMPNVLLKPGEPWWRGRVLLFAGKEYAADIKQRFGLDVELRA